MKLLRVRYARIDRLVEQLLDEHEVDEAPVRIEVMVRRKGIELKIGLLGDKSGLFVRRTGNDLIAVNSAQPRTRQRFTIAHELGHYLLHASMLSHSDEAFVVKYRDDVSSSGRSIEEVEANYFAASLLMPKRLLELDHAERVIDIEDARTSAAQAPRDKVS